MTRIALLTMLLIAACGGDEPQTGAVATSAEDSSRSAGDTTAAAPGANAGASAPSDFSASDLDEYAKGIAAEVRVVKEALDKAANAQTPQERAQAAQQSWEEQSVPAAAQAAGIDAARYAATRAAVHEVFETLDFQGKIDGPLEMDLSRVGDDVKQRLARDPFNDLTPSAAALLRQRMDSLVPLWIEYVNLTAVSG